MAQSYGRVLGVAQFLVREVHLYTRLRRCVDRRLEINVKPRLEDSTHPLYAHTTTRPLCASTPNVEASNKDGFLHEKLDRRLEIKAKPPLESFARPHEEIHHTNAHPGRAHLGK